MPECWRTRPQTTDKGRRAMKYQIISLAVWSKTRYPQWQPENSGIMPTISEDYRHEYNIPNHPHPQYHWPTHDRSPKPGAIESGLQIPSANITSIIITGLCNNRSKITSPTRLHDKRGRRDFGNVTGHNLQTHYPWLVKILLCDPD